MSTDPTPAERRGYPLPPWAQAESPAEHTAADVLEYLLGLLKAYPETEEGVAQAEAYLDAWLARHREAQGAASRCHLEDHDGAVRYVADAKADALAAHGRVRELERTVDTLRLALSELEELHLAGRPAVTATTELEDDEELGLDVLAVRLAFVKRTHGLDDEARHRIAEAASVAVYVAYEREHAAAVITAGLNPTPVEAARATGGTMLEDLLKARELVDEAPHFTTAHAPSIAQGGDRGRC